MSSEHPSEHMHVADGTSLFFPNFCQDMRIDPDALYEAAVEMPWMDRKRFFVHLTTSHRTDFLTYLTRCLSIVFGFRANHVTGAQYSNLSDVSGAHSDRPLDLCPKSWIVIIRLGDTRDFVLKERLPEEHVEWLRQNDVSEEDPYVNFTGRSYERITMTHGSAVLLSTATNSRWTHEVPVGQTPMDDSCNDSCISLVFRDVQADMKQFERILSLVY